MQITEFWAMKLYSLLEVSLHFHLLNKDQQDALFCITLFQ